MAVQNKYQNLYKYYDILLEKHKVTYDFFIGIISRLNKIYKQLDDKKIEDISEIEYEKIKLTIKKIKHQESLKYIFTL